MTHRIEMPKCEFDKPREFNCPLRVWQYVNEREAESITATGGKIRKLKIQVIDLDDRTNWEKARPIHAKIWKLQCEMTGLRKLLRKRRSEAMNAGLYISLRKWCHAKNPVGMYGSFGYHRIEKGDILMWAHRDELGRNFFITKQSRLITMSIASMDAIARIAPEESGA